MVNRNALPRWLNAGIDAIADAPTSVIGRLAARRLGAPAARGSVPATHFADRPRRVLIAPVNYSGQATAWARALERADPALSARSMAVDVPGGFSFAADLVVPVSTYHNDRDWQERQRAAAYTATHLLVEAEEPPFGRLLGRSVRAQVDDVIAAGVDVAFLAHGTDVRLPSRHLASTEWSPYHHPSLYVPRAETLAARNIAYLADTRRPVFVSTPDLLVDVPWARWCPVVVDPQRWAAPPREPSDRLRVAHAPSVGPVKGTDLLLPALRRLEADGVIELELVQGVASADMPAVFARADVVVDQVRLGSYGVAACEALAAGCVVVGRLSDQVRETVQAQTGSAPPIVQADPRILEDVLRELAGSDLAELRAEGIRFVQRVHDGSLSARILRENWIAPHEKDSRKAGTHASGG